jgi:hypothetical protein
MAQQLLARDDVMWDFVACRLFGVAGEFAASPASGAVELLQLPAQAHLPRGGRRGGPAFRGAADVPCARALGSGGAPSGAVGA